MNITGKVAEVIVKEIIYLTGQTNRSIIQSYQERTEKCLLNSTASPN